MELLPALRNGCFATDDPILKFRQASRGVVDDRLRLYPRDLFPIQFSVPTSVDEQRAISRRLEAIKSHSDTETETLQRAGR